MATKTLTLPQLLDLIEMEDFRGILDKDAILKMMLTDTLPREIKDIAGDVRLAIKRMADGGFSVEQRPTALANSAINQVY